ncbi:MAG: hypothetical protein ABSH41_18660 [Syntrophobacteraceae bacterium]
MATTNRSVRLLMTLAWTIIAGLPKGMKVGETFMVHLDGYNITDALAGNAPDPSDEFFYFNDDGSLIALRYAKVVFAEQRAEGFDVWQEPFVTLRFPKLYNLRSDPFERADKTIVYPNGASTTCS